MNSAIQKDIDRLMGWLGSLYQIPIYSDARIIDDRLIDYVFGEFAKVHEEHFVTLEDFRRYYDEKKHAGYSWINLNCAGILDDLLIVVVEYPNCSVDANETAFNTTTCVEFSRSLYSSVSGQLGTHFEPI